jgi:hypothetical protein
MRFDLSRIWKIAKTIRMQTDKFLLGKEFENTRSTIKKTDVKLFPHY